MEQARRVYFGGFIGLADQMRKLSSEGAKYPMAVSQFVDTTTPQLGSLLGVLYGAGKASEAYTDQYKSAALWSLALNLAALLIALAVAAASFHVVIRRVSQPLQALSETVRRLADRDLSVEVPLSARRGHPSRRDDRHGGRAGPLLVQPAGHAVRCPAPGGRNFPEESSRRVVLRHSASIDPTPSAEQSAGGVFCRRHYRHRRLRRPSSAIAMPPMMTAMAISMRGSRRSSSTSTPASTPSGGDK